MLINVNKFYYSNNNKKIRTKIIHKSIFFYII